MFLAIARNLNLENIRDIPLRPCGTSRYSTEIAEAFITVYLVRQGIELILCPQTAATTFAFSYVLILLPWLGQQSTRFVVHTVVKYVLYNWVDWFLKKKN